MREKATKIKRDEIFIIFLIVVGIIAFWIPYFGEGFTRGAENPFHYARIMTLADSLQTGIFPAKIRPTHMKLFGYGIGFFYPDILIYPPAALIALGAEYEITIKIYLFLITLLESLITYKCLKELTGNRWMALIGEILILNSAVNDQNIFDGGGMPHLFAYLFIPLALCGLLQALEDKKHGYIEYAVGLTMVLLTHNMIFLTLMFAMIIIVLIHIKKILEKPVILLKLFGISLAAMVFTTAYWLPAMEQVAHIKFIVFNDNAYSVTDHITDFWKMVTDHIGILYFGLFALSIVLYFLMLIRKRRMPLDITSILVTSVFIIWFMCSKAVWNSAVGEVLSFFEYTNRFEYLLVVMMVMFVVMTFREALCEYSSLGAVINEKTTAMAVICVAVLVVTRFSARPGFLNPAGETREILYKEMLMEGYQVSGAEWLPMECEPSACTEPENAKANDGTSADGFKHENAKYFEVWLDLDKEYYDMPYVYYYGYKAYVLDNDENPVEELEVGEAYDDNGYVRVFMPKDRSGIGHVMVTYRKTAIQKLSYAISAVSAVILMLIAGLYLARKAKR